MDYLDTGLKRFIASYSAIEGGNPTQVSYRIDAYQQGGDLAWFNDKPTFAISLPQDVPNLAGPSVIRVRVYYAQFQYFNTFLVSRTADGEIVGSLENPYPEWHHVANEPLTCTMSYTGDGVMDRLIYLVDNSRAVPKEIDSRLDGMAVKYNEAQTLTEPEKAQARSNIGAEEADTCIKFAEAQTLTELEQAQARTNIDTYGTSETDNKTFARVYRSLADLGLSGEAITPEQVFDAMVLPSIFTIQIGYTGNTALLPNYGWVHSGNLTFNRAGANAAYATFNVKSPNNTYGKSYIGHYRSSDTTNKWSGWEQLATKTMPLLWSGSFTSGSITVPGISNYKMIVVDVANVSIPLTAIRSVDGKSFLGGGNYDVNTYTIDLIVNGDTVTYGTCTSIEHLVGGIHGSRMSGLAITSIRGVI